jgi:hypothetical protein
MPLAAGARARIEAAGDAAFEAQLATLALFVASWCGVEETQTTTTREFCDGR